MGRHSTTIIKEDVKTLENLYKKETNTKLKRRIKCLLYTKNKKYTKQSILATNLGVAPATIQRWLKEYREKGLATTIALKPKGHRVSEISASIHDSLSVRLNSSTDSFRGYWEVQLWLNETYNKKFKYNTVRTYLIRHFKTKLKSPRKSHYKKDEQAIEAFFKTSRNI